MCTRRQCKCYVRAGPWHSAGGCAEIGENMSDNYQTAWRALNEAIGAAKGQGPGSITDTDHLTVDQQLKVAEVAALLSISQELSALNPQNTSSRDDEGNTVNGWGIVTKKAKPKPGKIRMS